MKAVDMDGSTPLHYAAMEGHSAIVDALLKAGADGTAKDKDGKSPADLALENKHPMIVAKCDPAFAKAEGEKLRKAFEEATTLTTMLRFLLLLLVATASGFAPQRQLPKWHQARARTAVASGDCRTRTLNFSLSKPS